MTQKEPPFEFAGPALLAHALHAQLLARRRTTLEHDLKNVVHSLLSGTELLGKALATASPRISPQECLTLLQQQLGRAQTTLHHLLDDVAPTTDAGSTEIELAVLVNECTQALRHQLQSIRATTTIEPSIKIHAHRTWFKNVLLCILLDSIESTPGRSTLSISARSNESGSGAVLQIEHAQDPSQSQSSVMPFMGELLNADSMLLEIDSTAAHRIVTISMPLAMSVVRSGSAAQELVVLDANRDAADSIAMLLQLEGFAATPTYDTDSALAAIRTHAPIAVLVDLDGSINSELLLRKLREQSGLTTRVIGLTHSTDQRPSAIESQLRKPLDTSALLSILSKAE
jgi:hypothetical protein